MNEFIIWDKRYKTFRKPSRVDFEEKVFLCKDTAVSFDKATTHGYIGKTDMEGNKIYADSSIVEFDYLIGGNFFTVFKWKTFRGYFYFCENTLSYRIKTICGRRESYHISKVRNLKIIDTIQENKLGLIKS